MARHSGGPEGLGLGLGMSQPQCMILQNGGPLEWRTQTFIWVTVFSALMWIHTHRVFAALMVPL